MRALHLACLALFLLLANAVQSQPLNLSNEPLATAGSRFKPNIAMVVDDSGSMIYSFVPDSHIPPEDIYWVTPIIPAKGRRCDGDIGYNPLFYNPTVTYLPPYKIDGQPHVADQVTRFPDSSLKAAPYDGYFALGEQPFDLLGQNDLYDWSLPSRVTKEQLARLRNKPVCPVAGSECAENEKVVYYFTRNVVNPGSSVCESDSNYTLVTDPDALGVPSTKPDGQTTYGAAEIAQGQTNYANWFTYYRLRGSIMKQAVGEAFRDLDPDRFRVGLFFINSVTSGARIDNKRNYDLPITEFTADNRRLWYERLYGARQGGSTPLRGALSRIGRMFAGQIADTSDDGSPPAAGGVFNPTPAAAPTSPTGTGGQTGTAGVADKSPVLSASGKPVLHWDPVQAVCQKNRVILATDGSWNQSGETDKYGPFDIAGNRIGDVDGLASVPRPYRDIHGNAETLADVAYYYANNDLRKTKCENIIDGKTYGNLCSPDLSGTKPAGVRMLTFTLGLGISGDIPYSITDANNSTFLNSIDWPPVFSDPVDFTKDKGKVDDLWHAAVNGLGTYFNASSSIALQAGIKKMLDAPDKVQGSGASLAVSSRVPSSEKDLAYVVSYSNNEENAWSGDLTAYAFDPNTDYTALDATPKWSAQQKLLARRAGSNWPAGRKIHFFSATSPDALAPFDAASMDEATRQLFSGFCNRNPTPGQCGNGAGKLNPAQVARANDSASLVAWLRGDSSNEIPASWDRSAPGFPKSLYRSRESQVLGDIVNAAPVYAAGPPFNYALDPSYGAFKIAHANRRPMLYAGANDGMLHAFDAGSGDELWAYVPRGVMGNMWRLADIDYATRHQYFVDGRVVLGDVCSKPGADRRSCADTDSWRSILVAGLNKGGCGYYALDVTNPEQPRGLWEFSNTNLGYSFGEPIVGRLRDGTWVVVVASGYNNRYANGSTKCAAVAAGGNSIADVVRQVVQGLAPNDGDGHGHVFVIDAVTGRLLRDIRTPLASDAGGLVRLNAWFEMPSVPEISRLYGGDLEGRLWRFDLDDVYNPAKPAVLLASLKDAAGRAQPITTAPLPIRIAGSHGEFPVILVGTGRYLAAEDAADLQLQTVYAIKDDPSIRAAPVASVTPQADSPPTVVLADSRGSGMVARSIHDIPAAPGEALLRTIQGLPMDWETKSGWYTDLQVPGSAAGARINIDMQVSDTTLLFIANTPPANMCAPDSGSASLYYVDMVTGLPHENVRDPNNPGRTTSNLNAGILLSSSGTAAGFTLTSNARDETVVHVVKDTGKVDDRKPAMAASSFGSGVRRASWRELVE